MVIAKRLIIVFLIFIIILSNSQVFAATTKIKDVSISPDESTDAANKTKDLGQKIVGAIKTVGIFASVGMLIIIGLKFMMGSTEEKAEYKKTLLPYFIAAVAFFAVTQIVGVIYDFANEIF